MVDKVEVTDPYKLRPELKDMSAAEIKRRITELEMALEEKEEAEKAKARAALIDEAGVHVDRVLESLKWLHGNEMLAPSVVDFFSATSADGSKKYMAHLKLKKPRS